MSTPVNLCSFLQIDKVFEDKNQPVNSGDIGDMGSRGMDKGDWWSLEWEGRAVRVTAKKETDLKRGCFRQNASVSFGQHCVQVLGAPSLERAMGILARTGLAERPCCAWELELVGDTGKGTAQQLPSTGQGEPCGVMCLPCASRTVLPAFGTQRFSA